MMSTCPDSDLYSAYVDGEIPSPWKEKLEAHLAECESCSTLLGRYRAVHNLLQKAENKGAEMDFLEASFRKVSPRWEIAAEKAVSERSEKHIQRSRKTVTIPYFALAAMLLVAAFVPSFFAVRTVESRSADFSAQNAQQNSGIIAAGLQNTEPYSNRYNFPQNQYTSNVSSYMTAGREQYSGSDFTLIDHARMFSQDKNMFSSANSGYIIIRLPEMVRFGEEKELPPRRNRNSMQEWQRRESGHVINVIQQ